MKFYVTIVLTIIGAVLIGLKGALLFGVFGFFIDLMLHAGSIEEKKKELEEKKKKLEITKNTDIEFSKLLSTFFIIDSNIWMNEEYDAFFTVLGHYFKNAKKTMFLYGPQFDEICNIKNSTNYSDIKSHRARLAIDRIERFQVDEILSIKPVKIDAEKDVYADPLIIRLLLLNVKNGKNVSFVSDDKELRVRARELLKEQGGAKYFVMDCGKLNSLCRHYCKEILGLEKYQNDDERKA